MSTSHNEVANSSRCLSPSITTFSRIKDATSVAITYSTTRSLPVLIQSTRLTEIMPAPVQREPIIRTASKGLQKNDYKGLLCNKENKQVLL